MGLADTRLMKQATIESLLEEGLISRLDQLIGELTSTGNADLLSQGIAKDHIRAEARVHLKYRGSDSALEVDYAAVHDMTPALRNSISQRFAFTMPGVPLVVESVSVEMIGAADGADARASPPTARTHAEPSGSSRPTWPASYIRRRSTTGPHCLPDRS